MQPSLSAYLQDDDLQTLINSQNAQNFSIKRLEKNACWVEQLLNNIPEVALIQVDDFSEQQCQLLLSTQLLAETDILFFTNGKSNPFVDKAMHRGVSYHFKKPIDTDFVDELLHELYHEIKTLDESSESVVTSKLDEFGLLVGSSKPMRRLYRIMRKAAASDTSVLLVGESGTGKELVANTIHMGSERIAGEFVAVNCGALSPELIESELFGHKKGAFTGAATDRAGVFENAEGGTLFLDEITEMSLDHQVKLLRVLETGEYRMVGSDTAKLADVRVIAATNREPSDAIRDNSLREDLYYRLCQFPICIPTLRERDKDIIGLARHFLAHRNAEESTAVEIGLDAIEKIRQHSWPGNVRELKHAVERAYILADNMITAEHLIIDDVICDGDGDCGIPTDVSLEEVEKKVIIKTLDHNAGNKTETAEKLGISVKTLYNKLEKYHQENSDVIADPEEAKG